MAIMVRENPDHRARVRAEIRTLAGRRLFDAMFGAPVKVVAEDEASPHKAD